MKVRALVFIILSISSVHAFDSGVSLSGTGIGYSTATKGYFSVGAIYEKPYGDHFSFGLGGRSFFTEAVTVYGPQATMRYFLNNFDEGGWHTTVSAFYNFYNIKSDSFECGCNKVSSGAEVMYQWVFANHQYFSFGVGTGFKTIRVFPAIDFGFKF